jgi:hypothetical protein
MFCTFGFDNNANVHYTGDKSLLSDFRRVYGISVEGLGGEVDVSGIGSLHCQCKTSNGGMLEFVLRDVLFIENCAVDIISSHAFVNDISTVTKYVLPKHGDPYLKLNDGSRIRLTGIDKISEIELLLRRSKKRSHGSDSRLGARIANLSCFSSGRKISVDSNYAHVLLGHPSKRKMDMMRQHNLVEGLAWNDEPLKQCWPCALGKSKRKKTPRISSTTYSRRGELIVTDIEGPISTPSFGGNQYAVHFTDMYSRFSKVYFMKNKSQVGNCFKRFIVEECLPRGIEIGTVQTDNAGEYVGRKSQFKQICDKYKIATRHSSPYCHWENGVAERVILKMMEKSFTILAHRDLPPQYWCMALEHAYMMENCVAHSAFGDLDTPYRRWYDKRPNLSGNHIFGADVRVNVPLDSGYRKYTDPKSSMGI